MNKQEWEALSPEEQAVQIDKKPVDLGEEGNAPSVEELNKKIDELEAKHTKETEGLIFDLKRERENRQKLEDEKNSRPAPDVSEQAFIDKVAADIEEDLAGTLVRLTKGSAAYATEAIRLERRFTRKALKIARENITDFKEYQDEVEDALEDTDAAYKTPDRMAGTIQHLYLAAKGGKSDSKVEDAIKKAQLNKKIANSPDVRTSRPANELANLSKAGLNDAQIVQMTKMQIKNPAHYKELLEDSQERQKVGKRKVTNTIEE